ncbi:RND family efflux transporter, MFP subunit [Mizugakiibacter sediminis]|uniref:Membrane protein n=1 Tax=Mizugakiibacter sediminis TaxID=1475481 RepID=A0A0K8QK52_9GAMM|nr:efflux RND transporter periplasmic adaptor subunit [Mizugakiibacter sediminis]GAP65320.1 RND family efflux transporter, MFP subunit [Mizugakiibacter sediminis]
MSRGKIALIAAGVVVAGLIGWRMIQHRSPRGEANADAPVPVTVVPVERRDVPVYLDALGTVQALNTVTVRPQVGGQLQALGFKEGQEVRRGDVIAQIDPRTYQAALDQAQAKQKQDEAQLVAARSTLKRYEDLIKQNFVAAQDLENQRQTVRQLEATVAADAANVDSARVQLGYTRVTAPIDGLAGIRQVDVGNLVQPSDAGGIVVLTQVRPISVIFTLPEQDLDLVRAGGDGLAVQALNRADNRPVASGVLKVVDNQIDTATGTFKLKAEFPNADGRLWPGQFVNVRLRVDTVKGGLVVPAQAVQRGPDGSYVYLLQPDSTVLMQPVQVGGEAGDGALLVTSGVKAGDRVVTEGQFRLKPGAKVLALAPGQTPPPAKIETAKGKRRGRDG